MFNKIANLTEMSSDRRIWSEISGKMAVQVMHKGHEPKVVVSQEYFFRLLNAARIVYPDDFDQGVAVRHEGMMEEAMSFRRKLRAKDEADKG